MSTHHSIVVESSTGNDWFAPGEYCQRTDHALPIKLTRSGTELDRHRQPADHRLRGCRSGISDRQQATQCSRSKLVGLRLLTAVSRHPGMQSERPVAPLGVRSKLNVDVALKLIDFRPLQVPTAPWHEVPPRLVQITGRASPRAGSVSTP